MKLPWVSRKRYEAEIKRIGTDRRVEIRARGAVIARLRAVLGETEQLAIMIFNAESRPAGGTLRFPSGRVFYDPRQILERNQDGKD